MDERRDRGIKENSVVNKTGRQPVGMINAGLAGRHVYVRLRNGKARRESK